MPNDNTYAERDATGRRHREHDTVPVKRDSGNVEDVPRQTERAALDNLAYGEPIEETPEEREMRLLKTGKFAYCSRCGAFLPADCEPEHFRKSSDRASGWKQPCQKCARKLVQRAYWENREYRYWKKSGKFRKSDSGGE